MLRDVLQQTTLLMHLSQRLRTKDYRDLTKDYGPSGLICEGSINVCAIQPADEDTLTKWNVALAGQDGTPYAEGIFKVTLDLPPDYPMQPPSVRFITPIYHPNIDGDGSVNLDILIDKWSPSIRFGTLPISLLSLLHDPVFSLSCWPASDAMQQQIRFGIDDPAAWRAEAARHTAKHAISIPRVDWQDSHALFLAWVGQQLAGESEELLQPWIAHVVPRAMCGRRATSERLLLEAVAPQPS